MPKLTVEEWRALATDAVADFVKTERAFVAMELEARLAEQPWGDYPRIQPHHLTTARIRLEQAEVLITSREATRGRGLVTASMSTSGVKEAGRRAARKRLLFSRYISWTRVSSDWDPAPIGAALERVVHSSLTAAAPYGYRLIEPGQGEVRKLFNERVPGGPLDNGAYFTQVLASGMPGPTTIVLIEAKNVRQWIYPRTQELYQLLDKAVSLQNAHPELRFAPVLVCRRLHPMVGSMAKQMGFHVVETQTQYVRPVVAIGERERKFDEVNDELGFRLTAYEGAVKPMERQFSTYLPARIDSIAERWNAFAQHPRVPDVVAYLRDDEITNQQRHRSVDELGSIAVEVFGETVTWANTEDY